MTNRLAIFLIAVLAVHHPGTAAAIEHAGNVVSLRGKAVIEHGEGSRFMKVRDDVQEKDTVLTRERSRVKILFKNDSVLTLGPSGKLVVRQFLYNAAAKQAESLYELADGKLRAIVGAGAFKVQTPTAYAAARGTVFVMWFDAAGNTTGIAVIEGGLEIRNIKHGADRMVILVAGQMSTITGSDGPSPPEPFSIDLWGSGSDTSPRGHDLKELADLSDDGGDIGVTDVDDTIADIQQGQGGQGGQGQGDPFVPPLIEPPIDQQPVPPVKAPITVRPVFQ
ncbi:MAG: FecR family protein [Nitrospirota bacterium]|mgnify:CR=1 FL=1